MNEEKVCENEDVMGEEMKTGVKRDDEDENQKKIKTKWMKTKTMTMKRENRKQRRWEASGRVDGEVDERVLKQGVPIERNHKWMNFYTNSLGNFTSHSYAPLIASGSCLVQHRDTTTLSA